MAQFVLLLRDSGKFPGEMSAEEIQAIIGRYRAWRKKVRGEGKKLTDGAGKVISRSGVTDGPYVESREVIGGFFLVEAKDYEDAVRLCADCPHLEFGSIEVREVDAV